MYIIYIYTHTCMNIFMLYNWLSDWKNHFKTYYHIAIYLGNKVIWHETKKTNSILSVSRRNIV